MRWEGLITTECSSEKEKFNMSKAQYCTKKCLVIFFFVQLSYLSNSDKSVSQLPV